MTDYLHRSLVALRRLLGRSSGPGTGGGAIGERVGDNLVLAGGRVTFQDPAIAAAAPGGWIELFGVAAAGNVPVDRRAIAEIERQVAAYDVAALLPTAAAHRRFAEFLRPRPGLSQRLVEMRQSGMLGRLVPEVRAFRITEGRTSEREATPPSFRSVSNLERLLTGGALAGERFGTMLREIDAPELLVVSLLLSEADEAQGGPGDRAAEWARIASDRLALSPDGQQTVEFLIRNRSQMSHVAFRRDAGDPEVVHGFAGLFSSEERLKLLCLMTVASSTDGADMLTPRKADVLWRLFVDTYNDLTMGYADDVIDASEAALTAVQAHRPATIAEAELTRFLEGLPRRYLTLFDADSIYKHVELCRDLGPDDVHAILTERPDTWELTVVTLDKPYLFSNVCGVLAYLDLDIVRGRALTSLKSVVIDVFQFADRLGAFDRARLDPLVRDVIGGRVDITALLREKERKAAAAGSEPSGPVIYFDNESSRRYTILEIVAEDAPGLLHRVSRSISAYGCDVELVLISTEGRKAVDVFHLKKADAKLTDTDQLALTETIEGSLP